MTNLQRDVGRALLRQLSGFRGYPKGEGESRFIDVLCEVSLSVEHALGIVEAFDGDFPTIHEMRDTALNLRPKYEPKKPDQMEQWEKQYGKPDPAWSVRFQEKAAGAVPSVDPKERKRLHAEEKRVMLWQAIRDGIFYSETPMGRQELAQIDDKDERINAFKFWRQAAQRNERNHASEVAAFREQLQNTGWDELMVYDWANGEFPPAARQSASGAVAVLEKPITEADIRRELRAQGRDSGDGE